MDEKHIAVNEKEPEAKPELRFAIKDIDEREDLRGKLISLALLSGLELYIHTSYDNKNIEVLVKGTNSFPINYFEKQVKGIMRNEKEYVNIPDTNEPVLEKHLSLDFKTADEQHLLGKLYVRCNNSQTKMFVREVLNEGNVSIVDRYDILFQTSNENSLHDLEKRVSSIVPSSEDAKNTKSKPA